MRSFVTNKAILILIVLFTHAFSHAQEGDLLSPYSAYGLGDLAPQGFARQSVLGGMGLGISNPYQLNASVPSSYSNLLRPVFASGLRARRVQEDVGESTFSRSVAQFMGLGFGAPINDGSWGIGFGIVPLTNVGYRLSNMAPLADGQQVEFEYTGSGGLSKMYGGLSKRIWHKKDTIRALDQKILLGAQLNYKFGTITNSRRAIYPSNSGYFNTNSTASVIVRDPAFDLSAQYVIVFKDTVMRKVRSDSGQVSKRPSKRDMKLTVGGYFSPEASLNARRTDLTTSYFLTPLGVEVTLDTIDFVDRAEGTITLPSAIGFGVGLSIDDKWMYAVEIRYQDWEQLRVDVEGWELPSKLGSRTSYTIGVSYTPSSLLRPFGSSFFEKTSYSLAVRKEDDYLVINNSQLESYALTVGASFPLYFAKTRSRLTIGTELGTRGETENGGIRETYAELIVGVSITPDLREKWFKKRRLD